MSETNEVKAAKEKNPFEEARNHLISAERSLLKTLGTCTPEGHKPLSGIFEGLPPLANLIAAVHRYDHGD